MDSDRHDEQAAWYTPIMRFSKNRRFLPLLGSIPLFFLCCASLQAHGPDPNAVAVTGNVTATATDLPNPDAVALVEDVDRLLEPEKARGAFERLSRLGTRAVPVIREMMRLPEGRLIVTENLMPEFGQLNIEPARICIRDLFLHRLIEGKGLRRVIDAFGAEPKPTPRAVLELVERLAAVSPDWADTLLIDMGGATTDVYTNSEPAAADGNVILRGLPEPAVKRTVEGDLGMRVSARSVLTSGGPVLESLRADAGIDALELETWVGEISETPGRLPSTPRQEALDRVLAAVCVSLSIARHAGTVEESWTPGGKVFLQRGKDLRRIRTIIGSGGYLASSGDVTLYLDALAASSAPTADGKMPLLPTARRIMRDRDGLLPLLGNLASPYPELAATLAGQSLVRFPQTVHDTPSHRLHKEPDPV